MGEETRKDLERQFAEINRNFDSILNNEILTKEMLVSKLSGIRILLDYCEEVAENL